MDVKKLERLEDILSTEIDKVLKKGDLKDGNEVKCLKEALECFKIAYELKAMVDNSEYYGHTTGRGPLQMQFEGSYGRSTSHIPMNYGHSISDRMVAALEGLYDQASSQHEREKISAEIRRLKSEA